MYDKNPAELIFEEYVHLTALSIPTPASVEKVVTCCR
jgi:hypothetical protein